MTSQLVWVKVILRTAKTASPLSKKREKIAAKIFLHVISMKLISKCQSKARHFGANYSRILRHPVVKQDCAKILVQNARRKTTTTRILVAVIDPRRTATLSSRMLQFSTRLA